MPIYGNLVPGWSFENPVAGPPNANWSEWVETEFSGGGVATVEADSSIRRYGVYSCQLSITNNADEASVESADYIPIDNAMHYVFRFSHYKASGADSLSLILIQYDASNVDLLDNITVTPTGAAAWRKSHTVIHPAGEGGNDWNANCAKVKVRAIVDTTVADWRVEGISLAPFDGGKLSSFGSQVFVDGYEIGELTSIGVSSSGDVLDVSSHDSPDMFREFCAGVRDGGTLALEGNLDLSSSGQADFVDYEQGGDIVAFEVIFPFACAEFEFYGIANAFEVSAPYDDKLSWSGEVKVTGKPIFTEAVF